MLTIEWCCIKKTICKLDICLTLISSASSTLARERDLMNVFYLEWGNLMDLLIESTIWVKTCPIPPNGYTTYCCVLPESNKNPSRLHYSLKSSRPMIILLISLVPAPISNNLASRTRRPVGYSLTYPFPPRHWMACIIQQVTRTN